MAINFPDSPNNGDIYTVNGKKWIYEDGKWASYGLALAPDVLKVDSVNNRVGVNNLSPAVALDVVGSVDVSGSLTVDGDITVSGNTTTLNTTELYVEDNKITLNSGATGSATANAGIEVERGDDPNVEILWDETVDAWKIATDFTVDTDTFHVDSTNNRVGIGTASPSTALHLSSTGAEVFRIQKEGGDQQGNYIGFWDADERLGFAGYPGDDDLYLKNESIAGRIILDTDGAGTAMTILADGNVGIGTTSPSQKLDVNGSIIVPVGSGIMFDRGGTDLDILFKETAGSSTYGTPDDVVLRNPNGADIVFQTGGTNTRMTIKSTGKIGIGVDNPYDMLDIGSASNYGSFRVHMSYGAESFRAAGNVVRSAAIVGLTTGSAANVFISTANNTMYRSTSSLKYKTDVETLEDEYADLVFELRPVWYRSATGNDPDGYSYYGLIAEEVAEVEPRLVHFGPSPDCSCEEDEDGHVEHDPSCVVEPEGVFYERLVPHLINVVQRQQSTIDALTARIEALEAG